MSEEKMGLIYRHTCANTADVGKGDIHRFRSWL